MKKQIFTLILSVLSGTALLAQDPAWGTGWTTLQPGSPLLLEEDFTGFPFLHSDNNPNEGNSDNLDPLHPGYMDTTAFRQAISSIDTIFYDFYQCAFAPNWMPAYWYRDSVDGNTPPTPSEVSRGFVEISREYESWATIDGYFIIDLSQVEFIEAIRFTHSSTGGNKRGFTMSVSTDYGRKWDTLIALTGNINTSYPEDWNYDCQNSAYGMLWEYGLYMGSLISPGDSVLIRFTKDAGFGQTVRLHDLKIYGDREAGSGVDNMQANSLHISAFNGFIRLSEPADIQVYSINGMLLRRSNNVESLYIRDLPSGVYIVKARTDTKFCTRKIFN